MKNGDNNNGLVPAHKKNPIIPKASFLPVLSVLINLKNTVKK